ncbi:hypothetical protein Hanom_Chr00s046416g01777101 [Helianthus anomalus]
MNSLINTLLILRIRLLFMPSTSHDSTCTCIFITKSRGVPDLGRVGTSQMVPRRVLIVSYITSWRLLVIHALRVRMCHRIIRYIGPQLHLLSCPVSHTRQNLMWLDIPDNRELVLLRLDGHR